MANQNARLESWLTQATQLIRFGPDRKTVEMELREHIQDKIFDLQRLYPDMSEKEAQERALSQMGDAEEIGRELARIHRPWMGYLWRASQALLGLIILATVIVGVNYILTGHTGWFERSRGLILEQKEVVLQKLDPRDACASIDGYLITIPEAVLTDRVGETRLGVVIRTASPFFWAKEGSSMNQHISAVDNHGNRYLSSSEAQKTPTPDDRFVFGRNDGHGPFYQNHTLWLYGVDPSAEWVRLEYDWMGRSFEMTIPVEEVGT